MRPIGPDTIVVVVPELAQEPAVDVGHAQGDGVDAQIASAVDSRIAQPVSP